MRKTILILTMLLTAIACVACGNNSASTDTNMELPSSEEILNANVVEDNNVADNILGSNEENTMGNTPSNIAWGGRFAKQGEWIYYYSWNGTDGQGLYQIKSDGTEKKQLYAGMVSYINVINDYVYFYDIREDCIKKLDSTGEVETLENGRGKFVVVQDYIYYQCDSGNYRIKTDGTEMKLLINKGTFQPLNVVDGCLYYVSDSYNQSEGIYKKADEVDSERLCDYNARNDTMGEFIIVDGDYIYFTESSGIYRVKTDGADRQTIIEFSGKEYEGWSAEREFLIDNDYIYFKCNFNDWYRIKTDGSGLEKIEWLSGENIFAESNGVNYIAIFDNCVYLCNDDGIRIMSIEGKEILRLE